MYFGDIARPVPSGDEALIKVEAAALNRADILQRQGKYPPPPGASKILGLEISGTVVKAPESNQDLLDSKVMALISGGGYAEYVSVPSSLLLPVPPRLNMVEAAGIMEAFLTGWQSLKWLADLKKGEKVLIHAGASGVGSACIQLAKSLGAEVSITASASKHEFCRKLGADLCIDYRTQDFQQAINDQFGGVDVIIDFVGGSYFQKNIDSLKLDGRMVVLGLLGGLKTAAINMGPVLFKRLMIKGSTLRSRSLAYRAQLVRDFEKNCYQLLHQGDIHPVVDKVFPWRNVQQAHQYMEENRNRGKIILEVQ